MDSYMFGADPVSSQSSKMPERHVQDPAQHRQHNKQKHHQQQQQQQAKNGARKISQSRALRVATNGTPVAHDGQNSEGSSKRKRASLACNTCRLRKSKCDAERPKCMLCTNLDFECVYQYTVTPNNAVVGKEYLLGIEARMKCVEQLIGSLGSVDFSKLVSSLSGQQTDQPNIDNVPATPNSFQDARHKEPKSSHWGDAADTESVASPVSDRRVKLLDDTKNFDNPSDAMGSIRFGNEEDVTFFGPSSTIAFIGDIKSTLSLVSNPGAQDAQLIDPQRLPGITFLDFSRAASPIHPYGPPEATAVNIYAIPNENEVRSLVEQYFSNTNILYPFVHKPTFLTTYDNALKADFDGVRRTWLGLLNIVMAFGATASIDPNTSPQDKIDNAEVFYQRAFELCFHRGYALRSTCLESVLLLTLMSQYLQSTRKPIQCWSVHGLAVRVAIQLGLHSDDTLSRFPPLERDLRKRAWYGCVYHDRTLSMTFGRPMSIPQSYTSLQLPIDADDEDFLKSTAVSPTDSSSVTLNSFFIASIKLSDILAMILNNLYGNNQGCGKPKDVYEILAHVPEMERCLHEWRSNLPQSLAVQAAATLPLGGGPATIIWRQNLVLTLRYLQARLILHRIVVVQLLRSTEGVDVSLNTPSVWEDPFIRLSARAGVETCVETAREIIYIVDHVGGRPELLGAWWYTLFYVFNSALVISAYVLLLLRDCLPLLPDLINSSLLDIEKAEGIIEKLATNEKTARSCLLFLHHLRTALTQLAFPILSAHGNSMPVVLSQDDSEYRQSLGNLSSNSPFGPELGQFLLESDFDFLSNMMATTSGTDYGFQPESRQGQEQGVKNHQRQPSSSYADEVMPF